LELLQQHLYKLNVGGNLNTTGNLSVTGTYGLAGRYKFATGQANNNNGVTYAGNGATSSFAISPGHTSFSVSRYIEWCLTNANC